MPMFNPYNGRDQELKMFLKLCGIALTVAAVLVGLGYLLGKV